MTTQQKPKVSLSITSYKAERFIEEAIRGAFSQTYQPLEIILSDDCSPDKTFEIMQHMAANYKGPHSIVLNRNAVNLGLAGHVNKIFFELATGNWIMMSAGDDVSLSNRVERVMQFADTHIGAIHHNCIAINDDSKEIGFLGISKANLASFNKNDFNIAVQHSIWLKGASACYNRQMLQRYEQMHKGVISEDKVYAYRALHFGGIIYLDEPLMKYRKHEAGITQQPKQWTTETYTAHKIKTAAWIKALNEQILSDGKQIPFSEATKQQVRQRLQKAIIDLSLFKDKKLFNRQHLFGRSGSYVIKESFKIIFLKPYVYFFNKAIEKKNQLQA